jgi:hypothetical protein
VPAGLSAREGHQTQRKDQQCEPLQWMSADGRWIASAPGVRSSRAVAIGFGLLRARRRAMACRSMAWLILPLRLSADGAGSSTSWALDRPTRRRGGRRRWFGCSCLPRGARRRHVEREREWRSGISPMTGCE